MIYDPSRRIWRTHLPFHLLFLVIAVIGYFKAGTFVGFWIFAGSLALTAAIQGLARRYRMRSGDHKSGSE